MNNSFFSPVAFTLYGVDIYWYALAYIAGIFSASLYGKYLLKNYPNGLSADLLDKFIFGAGIIGMIIGGRLGHVIFYDLSYYLSHPLKIVMVRDGGMSFHGGLMGILVAAFIFCKRHRTKFFSLMDIGAVVTPIGLGLGRITNFMNAELYGQVTSQPWGVVFPHTDGFPRHPTQLYEAFGEGLMLFIFLSFLWCRTSLRLRSQSISGLFLLCYGSMRFMIEFFKDVAAQGGHEYFGLNHGHLLCIPMILVGSMLFYNGGQEQKRQK